MKEIIAIIRPKKMGPTKEALDKIGFPSFTVVSVLGRGKQRGIACEVDVDIRPELLKQGKSRGMKYVPKRLLSVVVKDSDVDAIVRTIIDTNRTEQIGDGRIFVCPVESAMRVRTNEINEDAIS
ncbi:MAG: P-II family nitrogen regulator [Methanomethylovorans sp.]|uniref:P-II family nitrogen regulator n=1 Tax=Methanomethylovorans sp. TaxID=2758717 RepID=UPI0035317DA3